MNRYRIDLDEDMSTWAIIVIGVAAIAVLYTLHRAALWLEREGWIRYIHNPPNTGDATGAAIGEIQRIFEPQTQHVYEMKEKKRPRRETDDGAGTPDQFT